jgi:hypothetical protein
MLEQAYDAVLTATINGDDSSLRDAERDLDGLEDVIDGVLSVYNGVTRLRLLSDSVTH